REGYADRLRKEAAKHKALAQWLTAERIYLDVSLDRNLKQAAAECWEFLGAEPPPSPLPLSPKVGERGRGEGVAPGRSLGRALEEVLRQRYLATLMNLAARKGAEAASVERLVKYLDRGIAADPEDGRWKLVKYRLLIARDQPKELEQELRQRIRRGEADSRCGMALGSRMAEKGRVAEAIKQCEAVEAADELGPAAYRSLADWYMVVNNRARHDRASAAVYKTADEYSLRRAIEIRL